MDFKRAHSDHSQLNIDGVSVETVQSTKVLGDHTEESLTWTHNTSSIDKKS